MIHHDHDQGSHEWLAARKGVITGSRFRDARDRLADKPEKTDKKTGEVTPAQRGAPSAKQLGYAMDTARERVGGTVPLVFANAAMRTGTEQEPHARMAYEALTGNLVQEVGFITTDDGLFGLSPDGLIDDDGVIEIKTMVSSATLFTAVADGDISDYVDQCNGYLWLLGRQWVDLVLYAPDLEALGLSLTIIRINRDEAAIEALESDLMAFAKLVAEFEAKLRSKAAIATAQAPATPEIAAAVQMVQVMGMTIPRDVFEATQFVKDYPLPDKPLSVVYTGAEPETVSDNRGELNKRLDSLDDTAILRILNFVRSRYGAEETA
jgi:exodeoxyribonuclease (lambda-induced)